MGKGEIARYEQFLLVPQCFQKASFPGASEGVIVWEWVKLPLTPLAGAQDIRKYKCTQRQSTFTLDDERA